MDREFFTIIAGILLALLLLGVIAVAQGYVRRLAYYECVENIGGLNVTASDILVICDCDR